MPRHTLIALAFHALFFTLVVTGLLPRTIVPYWTVALLVWAAAVPLRVSLPFFAAAVPLFIAIPLSPGFDNLTMWRPLAVVLTVRWLAETQSFRSLWAVVRGWMRAPLRTPSATALIVLFILFALSVTRASDGEAAVRRLILFVNAAAVPIIAFAAARRDPVFRRALLNGIGVSAAIITVAGIVQLISTYLVDIYAFMRIWGEGVQLRQYGQLWSDIVTRMGNTWFSYFGPQLSLRVFSLLPDSHSMPVYLLLALPALIAHALIPVARASERPGAGLLTLLRTKAAPSVGFVALTLLVIVLSGTRGIWAAYAGTAFVIAAIALWMRRTRASADRRVLWRYFGAFLGVFAACFLVAWPIFISPQFRLATHGGLLENRIRSIIDFGETSNRQRIEIWRLTFSSIREHPLLGVGIGNFPVILGQGVILSRAGSSAHNLWLHVAAEAGIAALAALAAYWMLWYRSAYRCYLRGEPADRLAAGWLLIAIPWVAAYLLTDAALQDERALLVFGLISAWTHASASDL